MKIHAAHPIAPAARDLDIHENVLRKFCINLGDVIGEGTDIYGDGVNIAARLETLADSGGILPRKIYDEVSGKLPVLFEDVGEQSLKNIAKPVRAYKVGPGMRPSVSMSASAYASGEAFNYPQFWLRPSLLTRYRVRRDIPRHMTVLLGGGSLARAR